ncbi:MAG: hypothetical protein IJB00_01495, partial [Akkermansia sp.]|nr:hypothetical protein [Akkermansia sp.]
MKAFIISLMVPLLVVSFSLCSCSDADNRELPLTVQLCESMVTEDGEDNSALCAFRQRIDDFRAGKCTLSDFACIPQ